MSPTHLETDSANKLRISVVIPTYNRSKFLKDAIESVIAQDLPPDEIFVIDDGSTDDTASVVMQFGNRVKYIYQDNQGPSASRNRGIHEAKGDLIAFLDSDDIWLPNKLAIQVVFFEKNNKLGLVGSAYFLCDINLKPFERISLAGLTPIKLHKSILYRNIFPTPSVVVRSECFKSQGFFDESLRFAEDWDMWIRIAKAYEVNYIPEPLVKVRRHGQSLSTQAQDYNFKCWQSLIDRHDYGSIVKRKALSWLALNKTFYYRNINDVEMEKKFLLESIRTWPFFIPGRYYSLFKMHFRHKPSCKTI